MKQAKQQGRTRDWLMPVIKYLRKTQEVTFYEQRDGPLCYVNGELVCVIAAWERVHDTKNLDRRVFAFHIPRNIELGHIKPVWFYLLFASKPNHPLYRVKKSTLESKSIIHINATFTTSIPLEFVGYLDNRGSHAKELLRNSKGEFVREGVSKK